MPIPPNQTPKEVETPVVEDSKTDDFGYDKIIEEVKPTEEVKAQVVEEKPVEKPATGYGKEEEEVKPTEEVKAPVVEEKKSEDLTEEEKNKKEVSDVIKNLDDGYNKDKITKFALDNKLSKAQLEAYVNLTKEEDQAFTKAQEEAKKTQKKAWRDELMKDAEFGGENFDKNVDRVEKVLQNYMPNTKKILTEKGSMLPPYIMRDFLGLAKALNPTTTLVTGSPAAPKEEDGNFLDNMYT